MKTQFFAILLIFTALCGCKSDPCKNVSCQNGGACQDGTCACPPAFEGSKCETKTTFQGTWVGTVFNRDSATAQETAAKTDTLNLSFSSTDPTWFSVLFNNFNNHTAAPYQNWVGHTDGTGIKINFDVYVLSGSYAKTGSASLKNGVLSVSWHYSAPGNAFNTLGTYTKR